MKSVKKGPTVNFYEQLESVVLYNRKACVEAEGEDYVRLKISLQLKGFAKLYSKVFPIRDYRKYILSDFSLKIFRMIREKPRRLIELIRYLQDTEKLSFFEARALILQFVGNLMRRGIAVVELPSPGTAFEEDHEDGPLMSGEESSRSVKESNSPVLPEEKK